MKKPKILKVFYNGTKLCDLYPYASKWEVIKYKVSYNLAKGVKIALYESLIALAVLITFNLGSSSVSPIYVKAEDTSEQRYADKIEALKDEVVNKLMACESAGYKEDDGLIILDTNNKASIGQAQWQVKSVQFYYKLMTGEEITKKEAVLLALDKKRAGDLVKFVAFKTNNKLSKDWFNCERKLDLDKEVEIIKKLDK